MKKLLHSKEINARIKIQNYKSSKNYKPKEQMGGGKNKGEWWRK
jgi:hypothetical protein